MAEEVHVLHVDDDGPFVDVATAFVGRAEGLSPTGETDVGAALDYLDANDVDCIVCDYEMPEMDGVAFYEAVRARGFEGPFVLFTGQGSEEIASEAITAGVDSYLQKETGTDQFTVLANRIETLVSKHRSERRAAQQTRINGVIREVNRRLVHAETRESVERAVCETLAGSDPYLFAWVGTVAPGSDEVRPRAQAGIPFDLDRLTVSAADTPHGQGPVGTAIRSGSIQIVQDTDDLDLAEWRELTEEYGVRSLAVIPLVHEGVQYGILDVYAGRREAFDETEVTILEELGDTIATAIDSVETSEALATRERELRQTTDELRRLFNHVHDAIVVVDVDADRIVECNDRAVDLTGYSKSDLRGLPASDLHPNDFERFESFVDAVVSEGEGWTDELTCHRIDGTTVPIEATAATIDRDGRPHLIVSVRDIGVRDRLERRFEDILDRISDIFYAMDEEWRITYMNGRAKTVFDANLDDSPDEYVGERIWDVVPGARETEIFEYYQEAMATQRPVSFETVSPLLGDWVSARAYPSDSGLSVYFRDISERKRRERELEATERLFETVFNNPVAFVGILDTDGTVERVNERAVSFAGVDRTAVEGVPFWDTPWWNHDENQQSALKSWISRAANGELVRFEAVHIAPDQRDVTIDGIIRPVEDGSGNVDRLIAIGRDISDRKRHEEQLERQNAHLEAFASVVSHDLRNPLSTAMARLELAREDCESVHLDGVEEALGRMDELISDVLTLARQGKAVQDPNPASLASIVAAAWETSTTNDDGATLETEALGTVRCDESRVRQLFENLFRNAVEHGSTSNRSPSDDAGEHGSARGRSPTNDTSEHAGTGVTVRVRGIRGGFVVEDDGPGIPTEERERVFEYGHSTTQSGTGFGLAIVKQIVDAHDWAIEVGATDAGGAQFRITGVSHV